MAFVLKANMNNRSFFFLKNQAQFLISFLSMHVNFFKVYIQIQVSKIYSLSILNIYEILKLRNIRNIFSDAEHKCLTLIKNIKDERLLKSH